MSSISSSYRAPLPRLCESLGRVGLFGPGLVRLARAPGRLDVMGGIADYSGSLVCEMPLAIAAAAAGQLHHDGRLIGQSLQEKQSASVMMAELAGDNPLVVRTLFAGKTEWARYVAGCVWWIGRHIRQQNIDSKRWFSGMRLLLDSDVPLGGGVSSSAAIEVATMTLLADLLGVTLSPMALAAACQEVENLVVGAPCGVMDQVTSCMGQEGAMLEILCQPGADGLPAQVKGQIRVPAGFAFVGIHSGVRHEVKGDPYTDTRVATFMGQKIISLIGETDPTQGWLAKLDWQDYGRRYRNQLPQWMTGQEFLDQYQSTHDRVTSVKPGTRYHVRAAVDHHVGEMDRVSRFVAVLKEEGPNLDQRMLQAGQWMYQSHCSYSDNARQGHELTDQLVAMVEQAGPQRGLYGAKITGGGCGGTVAVLLRNEPQARAVLAEIREQYTRQTGRNTLFFEGTSPGAAAMGVMKFPIQ